MSFPIPHNSNLNLGKRSPFALTSGSACSRNAPKTSYQRDGILEAGPRCSPILLPRSVAPLSSTTAQATAQEPAPSASDCRSNKDFHVRVATPSDYWAVSDMHCEAFYPRAGPLWGPMLRLDRVMSLQIGKEHEIVQKIGKTECLVAISEDPSYWHIETPNTQLQQQSSPSLGFLVDVLSKTILPPSLRENYATHHATAGILGAVVIDTICEYVPTKRTVTHGGVVRDKKRRGMAYLSNLAVSPAAQRKGLGARLLQEAEELALQWGCRSVALHVDPGNTPAVELYKNAGYRFVAKQPEWQRMIEGRQNPLALMLRVLPKVTITILS